MDLEALVGDLDGGRCVSSLAFVTSSRPAVIEVWAQSALAMASRRSASGAVNTRSAWYVSARDTSSLVPISANLWRTA